MRSLRGCALGGPADVVQRVCEKWGGGRHPADHCAGDADRIDADSRLGGTDQRDDPGVSRVTAESD